MMLPELDAARLKGVLDETAELAEIFAGRGWRLYLVGGMVRNLVLDGLGSDGGTDAGTDAGTADADPAATTPAADAAPDTDAGDFDLTTDAHPGEVKQMVEPLAEHMWTQGERFGTIGCSIAGRNYEITTHRKEAYDPVSRKPTVVFGDDIVVDLSRRDFTVNAMAIELPGGELIDPYDGAGDLERRVLATPLSAEESFRDDPLRMLRAARFVAQFGLVPSGEIVGAMGEMRERLAIVSTERVYAELVRLVMLDDPAAGFELLLETELDELVFAVGGGAGGGDAGAGGGRVLSETAIARLRELQTGLRLEARLAALLYDCQDLGALLRRLRFTNQQEREVVGLVWAAQKLLSALEQSGDAGAEPLDQSARRWMFHTSKELHSEALSVARVIAAERGLADRFREFQQLAQQQPELTLPVSGTDIMDWLDIPPGPEVKQALEFLSEQLIQQGNLNQKDARKQLVAWWAGAK